MGAGAVRDIRDCGAVPGELASPAVNAAVRACAAAGGGTVLVPAGTWRCGTIELMSDVCLRLDAGATIQASLDLGDYRALDGMRHGRALIAARGCRNASIAGDGCVDGRGAEFMDWSRTTPGEANAPRCADDSSEAPVLPKERIDRMICFDACTGVRVRGVRLRESPCWCLTMVGCEDVWCTDLDIRGHERIPNNDGIHLAYCRRATVSRCHIQAADDAVALTSIKGGTHGAEPRTGEERADPPWCEDITVSDCVLATRGAGVRIGFMDDFVRRVLVHDCLVRVCHRGFLVSARNDGVVEDVRVHDCHVRASLFHGNWWGSAEPFQVSGMGAGAGRIRNVEFVGIDAEAEHGAVVWTDARFPVEDVRLARCRIRLRPSRHADTIAGRLDLRPRSAERDIPSAYFEHDIPGIYAHRVRGLQVEGCSVRFPEPKAPYFGPGVHAAGCPDATLRDNDVREVVQDDAVDF